MSDPTKWKSKLLSSSVPMEYEVAKILVASDFGVYPGYTYSRDDAGHSKDFSADIHALGFCLDNTGYPTATIELLVECKHRHQGNKWLFFPDPNTDEMSPFTLGYTIRAVDNFSRVFFQPNVTVAFDEDATFCMKGVEVEASSGAVHDSEIRHGLAQLQYALPGLVSESIELCLHSEKNDPFFFCPILLTTSEILVAHETVSMLDVEHASALLDIAVPTKYVIVHMDQTPGFQRHRRAACSRLDELSRDSTTREINAFRRSKGEFNHQLPADVCRRLATSEQDNFYEYFSQIVICSFEHFPELIKKIKTVCSHSVEGLVAK